MNALDIIQFIRDEVLPKCFQGVDPARVEVRISGSVQRPTSRVWFAEIVEKQHITPIVVKCGTMVARTSNQRLPRITPTVPAELMISRQASLLSAIDYQLEQLNDPSMNRVKVLFRDAERRILVMTRIPGVELLSRLHAAARPLASTAEAELIAYSRLCGKWLALFHQTVDMESGVAMPVSLAAYHDQALEWLRQISPEDKGWSQSFKERLKESVDAVSDYPTALLHGDFWPGNVLVEEGRIGVIDILGWAEGPIWLDICYYLLHLRAVPRQVLLHNAGWSSAVLSQAEQAFLEGYFGGSAIDQHGRDFFFVYALLAKWASGAQVWHEASGFKSVRKRMMFSWKSDYYRRLLESEFASTVGSG